MRGPVANPQQNTRAPARGAPPRAEPTLAGCARRPKPARTPSLRERAFDDWLARAAPGQEFTYHRGHLALDREHDRDLAALQDRLQQLSDGQFDLVTACGHVRGEIVGAGQIQLLARRNRDETVYFARKR
jgi:hypothetical protein